MPARSRVHARACSACATKLWCCNSAAPPARWPRSGPRPRGREETCAASSIFRCRTRPGTAIATGSAKSPPPFRILAGTCGKIARDVSLLMQTEIAEAFEPAADGRGGSSSMPHKRNPVAAAAALACAQHRPASRRAILAAEVQEHERSAGAWAVGMADLPRARAGDLRRAVIDRRISPRVWKSIPSACAPISTSRTDRSWRRRSHEAR